MNISLIKEKYIVRFCAACSGLLLKYSGSLQAFPVYKYLMTLCMHVKDSCD